MESNINNEEKSSKQSTPVLEHVESKMVLQMKKKIEELEKEKASIAFYEDNTELLTSPVACLFEQVKIYPEIIPVDFVLSLHNMEASRDIYVFDLIDIIDTKGKYPVNLDPKDYMFFAYTVDNALRKVNLSASMKMNQEQREHFDECVRKKEQESQVPKELPFSAWFKIISKMIFVSTPDIAKDFLAKKHEEEIITLTRAVKLKCHNLRLSNSKIIEYLEEAMRENNINYSSLRKFTWGEYEKEKTRMKIR